MHLLELNEARKNLESCLSEELRTEYFKLLRQWFLFSSPITREDFDREVRKLFINEEQVRCHNYFLLAILRKSTTAGRNKGHRLTNDKGLFENADFSDYVQPSSPTMVLPTEFESRKAAAELFIPDSGFISSRIAITAWKNGMEGADDSVTEVMVHACQVFVKNIVTAMVSRRKGYKIRDNKFQYGFNQAVPDPFIRNFNNVMDETQESKVEVEDDSFQPKYKLPLEVVEQQVAFAHSCATRTNSETTLNVSLLYDTVRENPQLLGLQSIHNINLSRLGLHLSGESNLQ